MKKFLILFISSILIITGQTEVLVNSYQDTTQQSPAISRDGSGNYIIVWNSTFHIFVLSNVQIFIFFIFSDLQIF